MTNFLRSRLVRSAAVVLAATAGGSTAGLAQANLPAVLKQMDVASTKFQSAEADFRWDLYQRVVRETTTQTGTIYFLKANGGTQMGAKIAPPGAKVVEYKDAKLRLFDPSTDHLTQRSAGGNQAQYESFLTLGFGGSGSDLEKTWNITDQGSESISDGEKSVATEKLDLVAKDPNLRNTFTHVTIWVDPTRGISLKQQFFTPSDDVRTAVYSHIRYNQKVDLGKFAIKTDKKTTVD